MINCAKRYNFLRFPEVLVIGFDYDPEADNSDNLPLKIEQQINLSFFISEDDVENQDKDFTKYLSMINEDLGQDVDRQESYTTDLYELKGFVKLKKNYEGKGLVYTHYTKLKGKWLVLENGKQRHLTKPPSVISTGESPVVFCYYERIKPSTVDKRNIESQLMISSEIRDETPVLSIPEEFVYKTLYLEKQDRLSLDFYYCHHRRLKPLYQDGYGFKKKGIDFNQPIIFPYRNKKKFNRDLEEYRAIAEKQEDKDDLFNKSFDKEKLGFSNTIQLKGLERKDKGSIDCSFARLNYLANSVGLPRQIAQYLIKDYNHSNKGLYELEEQYYAEKCQVCSLQDKRIIIKRILLKALTMSILTKKEERNFLIDICWFNNFKLFLLADLSEDNLAKHLYNHEYVTEKFNVNMHFYYTQFKHSYGSSQEMLENEFVTVNNSFFWFLNEMFTCEDVILLNSMEPEFIREKEFFKISDHQLSPEETQIHSLLLRFLGKEQSKSDKVIDIDPTKILSPIDRVAMWSKAMINSLFLYIYDDLLFLNKQMNVFIKTKIKTDFKVFDSNNDNMNELDVWKNLKKVRKIFGTNNLDAIKFNPCLRIKEIIENAIKEEKFDFENKESTSSCAYLGKLMEVPEIKESNVINQMSSEAVNQFLDSIECEKQRQHIRNSIEKLKIGGRNKKSLEFDENFKGINKKSLFSKDSSIYTESMKTRTLDVKKSSFQYQTDKTDKQSSFRLTQEENSNLVHMSDVNNYNGQNKITATKKSYFTHISPDNVFINTITEETNEEYKKRLSLQFNTKLARKNTKKIFRNSLDIFKHKINFFLDSETDKANQKTPIYKLTIKNNNSLDRQAGLITFEALARESGKQDKIDCIEEENSFESAND